MSHWSHQSPQSHFTVPTIDCLGVNMSSDRRPSLTPAQLLANRDRARKSTGPRSVGDLVWRGQAGLVGAAPCGRPGRRGGKRGEAFGGVRTPQSAVDGKRGGTKPECALKSTDSILIPPSRIVERRRSAHTVSLAPEGGYRRLKAANICISPARLSAGPATAPKAVAALPQSQARAFGPRTVPIFVGTRRKPPS
jgi:hypothetical protein